MDFLKRLFGKQTTVDVEAIKQTLKPRVAALQTPAVRLTKSASITGSKFGGQPKIAALPFDWPVNDGRPMAFLAQLDLQEMAAAVTFDWLPSSGSLLFFYDVMEMPWGFDPADRGKWRVIYQTASEPTKEFPVEYPTELPAEAKIPEMFVEAKREMVLPDADSPETDALKLTDDELDVYYEMNNGEDESVANHQLGGFPAPVQGNYMALESQLASNGVNVGTPEGFQSDRAKALEAGADAWRLLLQFDSDDDLDLMWGDCGMLYFWVEAGAAKEGRFENTWLILQCC